MIRIQRLFGFDHYSIVPLFHHSMGVAQIEIAIKLIVNPYSYRPYNMLEFPTLKDNLSHL